MLQNIWHEDIVYNILCADPRTAYNISLVNKMLNGVYNNDHYWKYVFTLEYKHVRPLSNNWKIEYKNMHFARKTTSNIISPIILLIDNTIGWTFYIGDVYKISTPYIPIDINKLYWLPQNLRNKFPKNNSSYIWFQFSLQSYQGNNLIYANIVYFDSISANEKFFSLTPETLSWYLYHIAYIYPGIPLTTKDKGLFFKYEDLIRKSHLSPNEKRRLDYYNKISQ